MAQKITDPLTFLTNLVSKRGKSDLFGVYLTGVKILAESQEDYGYTAKPDRVSSDIEAMFQKDEANWNRLLVETRKNPEDVVHPVSFVRDGELITTYFVTEGHEMSAMVFIPTSVVDEFVTEVTFYQQLLKEVAKFAGKTPTSILFTIGVVWMEWSDMVESGAAREVDVGF